MPGDKQSELFLIGVFVDVANYSKLTGIPIVYENLYFNEKGNFRKAYCLKDNGFKLLTHSQQSDYLARGRNWLLISHSEEVIVDESEILKSIFLKRGQLLLEYKAKGVGAYLFEIK